MENEFTAGDKFAGARSTENWSNFNLVEFSTSRIFNQPNFQLVEFSTSRIFNKLNFQQIKCSKYQIFNLHNFQLVRFSADQIVNLSKVAFGAMFFLLPGYVLLSRPWP